MRRKPEPPKPNHYRCPIPRPKPRDCAWCFHRDDCPRRADGTSSNVRVHDLHL